MPMWFVQMWALVPWSLDEGVGCPGAGVSGGYEPVILTQILSEVKTFGFKLCLQTP